MVIAIFSFGMSLLVFAQWIYNKAYKSNPLVTSGVMKGISQTSNVLGNWLSLVDGTLHALQRTKAFTNITSPVPHKATAPLRNFGSASAGNQRDDEDLENDA